VSATKNETTNPHNSSRDCASLETEALCHGTSDRADSIGFDILTESYCEDNSGIEIDTTRSENTQYVSCEPNAIPADTAEIDNTTTERSYTSKTSAENDIPNKTAEYGRGTTTDTEKHIGTKRAESIDDSQATENMSLVISHHDTVTFHNTDCVIEEKNSGDGIVKQNSSDSSSISCLPETEFDNIDSASMSLSTSGEQDGCDASISSKVIDRSACKGENACDKEGGLHCESGCAEVLVQGCTDIKTREAVTAEPLSVELTELKNGQKCQELVAREPTLQTEPRAVALTPPEETMTVALTEQNETRAPTCQEIVSVAMIEHQELLAPACQEKFTTVPSPLGTSDSHNVPEMMGRQEEIVSLFSEDKRSQVLPHEDENDANRPCASVKQVRDANSSSSVARGL
jgi:hypothetical protein